jgi:hypothetical protein
MNGKQLVNGLQFEKYQVVDHNIGTIRTLDFETLVVVASVASALSAASALACNVVI